MVACVVEGGRRGQYWLEDSIACREMEKVSEAALCKYSKFTFVKIFMLPLLVIDDNGTDCGTVLLAKFAQTVHLLLFILLNPKLRPLDSSILLVLLEEYYSLTITCGFLLTTHARS